MRERRKQRRSVVTVVDLSIVRRWCYLACLDRCKSTERLSDCFLHTERHQGSRPQPLSVLI